MVAKLQTFCSEDLGGFYLDVLKDRLYTTAAGLARAPLGADRAVSHRARPAAADGAVPVVHGRRSVEDLRSRTSDTIFTETYHAFPAVPDAGALLDKWTLLRAARGDVTKALEEARVANLIGSSLQAEVEIRASGARYDALASLGDDLKFVLITSAASVVQGRAAKRKKASTVIAVEVPEVRALLALPRGRRRERRTSRRCAAAASAICSAPAKRRSAA